MNTEELSVHKDAGYRGYLSKRTFIILSLVIAICLIAPWFSGIDEVSAVKDDTDVFLFEMGNSNAADGNLATHSNSIMPLMVETNLPLTAANLKIKSDNPSVIKVMETTIYKALGRNEVHPDVYLVAFYMKSNSTVGTATVSVDIDHESMGYTRSRDFKIKVEETVGAIELLTTQSVRSTIFGTFGLVANISNIVPNKSITLYPYINNNDTNYKPIVGGEDIKHDYEPSFDNIAPIEGAKVKWTMKSTATEKKYKKDTKYFINNKKGKITAKNTKKGIGVVVTASYKKAERDFYIYRQNDKNMNVKAITQDKPSRTFLLRGERRISSASYGPVLNLAQTTVKVTWTNSNKKVATVNSLGVITAKKIGKFKVTSKLGKSKNKKMKSSITYNVISLETFMKKYYKFHNAENGSPACSINKILSNRWA
jgi:hypothetical protein